MDDQYRNSLYIDRGYVIKRRGEVTKEVPKRELVNTYYKPPRDHAVESKAGMPTAMGDHVKEVLGTMYGQDIAHYDPTRKVMTSQINETKSMNGMSTVFDGEKPDVIGGRKEGGHLEWYRRKI